MVILPITFRRKFFNRSEWPRRRAGCYMTRVNEELLPDLQRPIHLQAVQSQNAIDIYPVSLCDGGKRLISLYDVDDLTILVRRADLNHTHRGGSGIAFCIAVWDKQLLAYLQF